MECQPDSIVETSVLQGGKAAAETILDMRATGDFSKASCREYARRWYRDFGYDFNNVRQPLPPEIACAHNPQSYPSLLAGS